MLDIAHLGGQGPLVIIDDAAGHVVGRKPIIGPDDADNRYVDVRKNVGRGPQRREPTKDRNQEAEHHKGVRPPQGDLNDPHASYLLPKRHGRRRIGQSLRARTLNLYEPAGDVTGIADAGFGRFCDPLKPEFKLSVVPACLPM